MPISIEDSVLSGRENTNPEFIKLLAQEGNGAVEAHLPDGEPLIVVIVGPIRTWWGRLDSPEYLEYSTWREAVRTATIHAGHLVYSPHKAWQGAWHEKAQKVNDSAIINSDVVVVVTPADTEAVGTAAEIAVAVEHGKTVLYAPPADETALRNLLSQYAEISQS